MKEINVTELSEKINTEREKFRLIDVRMPHEYEVANIGGELMPLPVFENFLENLHKEEEIIIHCKAGVRSARACQFLVANGFINVTNVIGGTDEWRRKVDSDLPVI